MSEGLPYTGEMFGKLLAPRTLYSNDPARGWLPWGLFVPILAIVFVAATVIVMQLALQQVHLLDRRENPQGLGGFVAFLLLPFGALGAVVLAWTRFVERRSLATIGLAPGQGARTFLRGILAGVAMIGIIVAGISIAGGFKPGAIAPAFHSATALASIAVLLACFCVQSSVEEIFFRGWMLSAVSRKLGVVVAIVLSSAVFALGHFDSGASWIFAVNVILFALFACGWCLTTGNIWGVMGWHAGWNWALATGFELRVTGLDAHQPALFVQLTPLGPAWLTGGVQGPEGSCVTTLLLIVGIALLALRRLPGEKRTAEPTPAG